jgi:hypothetical protein
MNDRLEAALEYLFKGFSVIPVKPDKTPFVSWQQFQKERPTESQIRAWWEAYPNANIGVITGQISGICVIDRDDMTKSEIEEHLSDSQLIPTACTPRGGQHLYFRMPATPMSNNVGAIPGCDFRGEGGYVVAPPSTNGTGTGYTWVISLNDAEPPPLPNSYISSINSFVCKGGVSGESPNVTESHNKSQYFEQGRRDEDLFHAANCLVKGYAEEPFTRQVLEILARNCTPPFPLSEIPNKVRSAIDRSNRRDRNITQEIKDWLESQNGHFRVTDYYNQSHVVTRQEKHAVIVAMKRLCDQGILEGYGERSGSYRKVNREIEIIDWQNAVEDEYPLELPLDIHSLVKLYPGNIAVLAGASNTGKTTFMLETIRLNQKKHPVTYLNSEMGPQELRLRLKLFEGTIGLEKWKFRAVERSSDFADVIDPDGFNVIDFMEIYDEFWKIGAWIKDIHLKLNKGIAIIAIQKKTSTKKENQDFGRGGELTLEKPRLYLAMDRGKIKVVKAKIWRNHDRNPNGLTRDFNIISGWKFKPKDEWREHHG